MYNCLRKTNTEAIQMCICGCAKCEFYQFKLKLFKRATCADVCLLLIFFFKVTFFVSPEEERNYYTNPDLVRTLSTFDDYRKEFPSFSFQSESVTTFNFDATFYKVAFLFATFWPKLKVCNRVLEKQAARADFGWVKSSGNTGLQIVLCIDACTILFSQAPILSDCSVQFALFW